jgi:hypothetical protein
MQTNNKAMNAILKATGEILEYPNPYFKPYKVISDIDFPPMHNRGYNVYAFSDAISFDLENMPEVVKLETANFIYFEARIQVFTPSGRTISGYFYKTVNKLTGATIRNEVDFS